VGILINIYQIVHGTKGHMAVYGPGCHPQNSIWSEANRTEPKGRSEKSQLIHTFTESKDSNCLKNNQDMPFCRTKH
jgi:hypothetical protein